LFCLFFDVVGVKNRNRGSSPFKKSLSLPSKRHLLWLKKRPSVLVITMTGKKSVPIMYDFLLFLCGMYMMFKKKALLLLVA